MMALFALLLLASMNVLLGAELADLHFLALYFAQYYPIHQNRMKTEWDFFSQASQQQVRDWKGAHLAERNV